MNHATHPRRWSAPRAFVLTLAALSALVASVGCGCTLSNTPMVIMQASGPGSGRVVALHGIGSHDEPDDPSMMLGYHLDAIPPAIIDLIEQANAVWAELDERYAAEFTYVRHSGLALHDWGGRVAALRLRPSSATKDGEHIFGDHLSDDPDEYAIWIERESATAAPYWHRTTLRMPTKEARLDSVQHGFATIHRWRSATFDAVYNLNTDPPQRIALPEGPALHAVSFRRDGTWAGLTLNSVVFGTIRAGGMSIEQTVAITPPDDRTYIGITSLVPSRFPLNAEIHLSADGQRALLHDFRIIARDGSITEAPEAETAFRVIGTPSRAAIVAARIGFVNPIPANFRRSSSEFVRIDLNTLEYSIVLLRGQPRGSLADVAPGFAAAIMHDHWGTCGIKGAYVHTLHTFNEQGRFSHRHSALTSDWPASGWYEEPTPQPNN